jgi:prolyl-tRNA synthetase
MSNTLPDIKNNFADWYNEVIYQAQLADQSPVRGTMIVRPYGCALWENIKNRLDTRIKETGHENALFPLFIPESFLKKEAEHVEGFAPELAVVTFAGGKKLEEPLVVRPTSETIIHYMFARWLTSWRDLPIKINQWANVVRWEMRPRPFLRTTEFFWQEGHTAHETKKEAEEEVLLMLQEYVRLANDYLAIPVVCGQKSEHEKFPGGEKTYTFEGLMQDGKALQMGTSHLLSQSFAKAFDMKFQDREGNLAYPYLTSWGVTTRLVGAVVMVHGDQKGLCMPPKVAPTQVVIIPIFKKDEEKTIVMNQAQSVSERLKKTGLRVLVDTDEQKTPGAKFYHWELRGVPLRVEIGPRDVANKQVVLVDRLGLGKNMASLETLEKTVQEKLDLIHTTMFTRAQEHQKAQWHKAEKLADFGKKLQEEAGFYQTGWCGNPECEAKLKEFQASTRCLIEEHTFKHCFVCGKPSRQDVLVAKAY